MRKKMNDLAVKKPSQPRSRQTHKAILDAVEALLHDRPFSEITTSEIATDAGVTTGAIYGRFKSKDDLLPHLYERYLDWIDTSVPAWFTNVDWHSKTAAEAAQQVARTIVRLHKARPWLIRAMVLYVRETTRGSSRRAFDHSELVKHILASLRACKGGTHASEAALVFAVHAALTVAREVIVFSDTPMARAVAKDKRSIEFRIAKIIEMAVTADS
jgi:AcrR family transcriptional regulator